jgi:tetrapyrrole methylase family protein/MazG family protein/ATP diphosphatase
VLEEACEVIDAIDAEDLTALGEELGDLALQVVFLSELARAEGAFGPDDVVRRLCQKLVRRHPHVFADGFAATADDVTRNWDAIKEEEKQRGLLDGIPRSLPALDRSRRLSERAASVGFDWPDRQGSRDKVAEELAELDEAIATGDTREVEAELGDVLFALVNLARHHGVDPEAALRRTGDKFAARFGHVEQRVQEVHGGWPRNDAGKPTQGLPLAELDAYWDEAKADST